MADGLDRHRNTRVDQLLHGYDRGHRRMLGSTTLSAKDERTVLVVSDNSSAGVALEADGYLTAYPLAESGRYALARTWPAPEMSRPGCVWTHTVLLSFADLAVPDSLASLLTLFRRPNDAGSFDYSAPLRWPDSTQGWPLSQEERRWAGDVLAALYLRPTDAIAAHRAEGVNSERVIMAIWSQQWPRLRRSFSFCTFSSERRTLAVELDLRVLGTGSSSKPPPPHTVVAGAHVARPYPEWVKGACSDLSNSGDSDLRSFLRRVGGDVRTGREVFGSLCRLYYAIADGRSEPRSLAAAARLLRTDLAHERARGAREKVVEAVLNSLSSTQIDAEALDFTLEHLDLVSPEVLALRGEQFGTRLWRLAPQKFGELFVGQTTNGLDIATRALRALPEVELVSRLADDPSLLIPVVRARPHLLANHAFWQLCASAEAAVAELVDREALRIPALSAMLQAGALGPLHQAVELLGAEALLAAAAAVVSEQRLSWRDVADGLRPAVLQTAAVAEFLATSPACPRVLLLSIARLVPPQRIPFHGRWDPWVHAVMAATGDLAERDAFYLSGYLLARALGLRSPQAGDLLRLSFEQVYVAAAADQLPSEVWDMLEGRLPWVLGWEPWDKCRRLRQGVAETLVRSDGAPDDLLAVARDDRVFADVVETLSGSYRGRKLLRRTRRSLQDNTAAASHRRMGIVDSALS